MLQAPNQFDTFSITAPNDSRLPEEARGRTLSGLYNVQQSVALQVNNVTMLASDAGGDYTQSPTASCSTSAHGCGTV